MPFMWRRHCYQFASRRWYKEEDEESQLLSSIVIGTSIGSIQQYDGTLIINQVGPSHAGKWLCVANNSLGEEKVTIKLVVISPLVLHIEPQTLQVDVGKQATFNCSLVGSTINLPVTWLKDARPLISDTFNNALSEQRIRLIEPTLLHIRSVVREDAGKRRSIRSLKQTFIHAKSSSYH